LVVEKGGDIVIIEGVDRYRVMEPLFEGIRIIMAYRGEKYSPAYIQGISGAAFRVAGICPCAPTCSLAMEPRDLVKLLGYEVEYVPLCGEGVDPRKEVGKVLERVKSEIHEGRPVLLWHAFTNAEWDVVCGFDEKKGVLMGRGSYKGLDEYAVEDETRTIKCQHICPALGAIFIGEKKGDLDARKAEIASLREAVHHARSEKNKEKLCGREWALLEGLMAYDRWISDYRDDPGKKRGPGDSYCLGVYRSAHRAASEYLKEIAPKYPAAAENLERAAGHFAAETDVLGRCEGLLGWSSPEGPDVERNKRVAPLLQQARDNYALGIQEIEKALAKIE
jgi:hypothetical protein